jgi:hypothetical protein
MRGQHTAFLKKPIPLRQWQVLLLVGIVSFSIENHSNHKNIENDYQSTQSIIH